MQKQVDVKLNDKQFEAYDILTDMDNGVTELLYGGGARGGKSWLGCFWQITNRLKYPKSVGFICREQLIQLMDTTFKTFLEVLDFLGLTQQVVYKGGMVNSFFFPNGSMIYFRSVQYKPRDPNFDRFGSYSITDLFVDESQEIAEKAINVLRARFSLLEGPNPDGTKWHVIPKSMYSCNPSRGWNYTQFVKPAKDGTLAPFRRFIKALPKDNPYITQDYIDNLLRSDKITIQRLYYGNFEYDDDPASLIDYDALVDLFHNEHIQQVGGRSCSADIATKGRDRFVAGSWIGNVCTIRIDKEYSPSKEVQEDLKQLMIKDSIPRTLTVVDADGVGSFLESYLDGIKEFHGGGKPQDSRYQNLRAECYFKLAELINARRIRVICTDEQRERIIDELGALKQAHIDNDVGKKDVIKKDEWKTLLGGKSPDYSDMLMMAMIFRRGKATAGAQASVKIRSNE